jgi:hypothetical protein
MPRDAYPGEDEALDAAWNPARLTVIGVVVTLALAIALCALLTGALRLP